MRNWDYRYCWLRDATFTIYSLMGAGYQEEARAFRDWLLRAVAGDPAHLQIMYGVVGERRLAEYEVDWLPGYEGSAPVRSATPPIASSSSTCTARCSTRCTRRAHMGVDEDPNAWAVQHAHPRVPRVAAGRSPTRASGRCAAAASDFAHSKVMAWVAFDRAVKGVEEFGLDGPVDRWRRGCATRSTARSCDQGLRRRPQHLHAVLRLRRLSTPAR